MSSSEKKKITISWSGGKDSAYALYQLLQTDKFEVVSLHTTFDAELKRVGMHGVQEELIMAQAEALSIPLEKIYLPKDMSHDSYERVMQQFYKKLKKDGVSHIMYGDIFLEDLKNYRDRQLAAAGIESVYPLWSRKTDDLIKDFLAEGFRTVVCAANAALFEQSQIGKSVDSQWLSALQPKIDPCGENGEFHTFVYNGPLFNKAIPFSTGNVVEKTYKYNKTEEDGSVTKLETSFWFQELQLTK